MNTRVLTLCAALSFVGAGMAALPAVAEPRLAAQDGIGFARATVYHVVTGEALPGIPVVVTRLDGPDGATGQKQWRFQTGKDGTALLGPLPHGNYEAHAELFTNRSDPAYFFINGTTDSIPEISLFINPDIDR